MKCLSPIVVSTRSRLLVPSFGEKLKSEVRCGKCANCQATLQKEWYFRSMIEYRDTVSKDGYMLMDCLTYSFRFVPKLSRFFPDLPKEMNHMCFDYYDFRYFMVRLREYLTRKGYDVKNKLRYFMASEYGTDERFTHRPHYHILFYVTDSSLSPYTLSRAVARCWHYGRTDGLPWKSKRYVDNYIIRGGLFSSQRASKYVTKYVMKDSSYQKVIDARLNSLLAYYYDSKFSYYVRDDMPIFTNDDIIFQPKKVVSYPTLETFLYSSAARKLKQSLMRYLNQFHRQSLGFGSQIIGDLDIESIINYNLLTMLDGNSIVFRLGLPLYYRRKLFYHVVSVNGIKSWQLNNDDVSIRYKTARDNDKRKMLIDDIQLFNYEYHTNYDLIEIADYVLNKRFRDVDSLFAGELSLLEKLQCPDVIYNYSSDNDFHRYHKRFITDTYLGVVDTGYINSYRVDSFSMVSYSDYIQLHSFEDVNIELILDDIRERKRDLNESIQNAFDTRQRLNQVYKVLCS